MVKILDNPSNTFVNNNVPNIIRRLDGPNSNRLQDKPTPTNYYHVNNMQTSTDTGNKDVDGLINSRSPIRYNLIEGLPVYGLAQIQLDLIDEDFGLNTEYKGTVKILPNTIVPMPLDYFTIQYLKRNFLFVITKIEYDTIKSNNFYQASFELKSTNPYDVTKLERLVTGKYRYISANLGTANRSIIKSEECTIIEMLDNTFNKLKSKYLEYFYDPKYGCFMLQNNSEKLFDNLLNIFCNRSGVFQEKRSANSMIIYAEADSHCEFDQSIFCRVLDIDTEDISDVKAFYYTKPIIAVESIFRYYSDHRVKALELCSNELSLYGSKTLQYLSPNLISGIKLRDATIIQNEYERIVALYLLGGYEEQIIDIVKSLTINRLKRDLQTVTFIPIVLYILRQIIKSILVDDTFMDENAISHRENN